LKVVTGLRINRVMAALRCIHNQHLEDLVTVLFELENGVPGTMDVSKVGSGRSGRYELICRDGQLHGDQIHGFTEIIKNSSVVCHDEQPQVPTILPLLEDWKAFLETGLNNPVSGEDGAYAIRVCDACLKSAAGKRWVEV